MQYVRHFPNIIFKNENVWIPIKISLKFVPMGPINNMSALIRMMAPSNQWWFVYRRISASLGLTELNKWKYLGIDQLQLLTGTEEYVSTC